ncbi:MAG: polysaccharide deacetylase family protein [Myxococcota bacterium]
MSSSPVRVLLAALVVLSSSCGTVEPASSPPVSRSLAAASSCPWEPSFGTRYSYQGDWWVEFSVAEAATALDVEPFGAARFALPWKFSFGDGFAKFTGGPDGPLTAGTRVRLHARNAQGQEVSSAWFAYRQGTPVSECGPCVPSCPAGSCGADGCGGTCACSEGSVCLANHTCCAPTCAAGSCGSDGCGGTCGCASGQVCTSGRCCAPSCAPGTCGSDGCGGACACPGGAVCVGTRCCTPVCAPGTCGSNGCGGTCACPSGTVCLGVTCCAPACAPGSCGSDGCGGACACPEGSACVGTTCCAPTCAPGTCGSDGCGGSCACPAGAVCLAGGTCCRPSCTGRACGDDGCGGSCGACASGQTCDGTRCVGGCVPPWSPTWTQGNGSPWWVEYQVKGGGSLARSVWLEQVGVGTVSTLDEYWTGFAGWGGGLASGTQVILHARDATGATAQTVPFRFLVDRSPATDPCAGTVGPVPTCRPLERGMLSLTMDDSVLSQVELARPVLARFGFKATVYEVVSQLETYGFVSEAQLMAAEGHEIGSHSLTHDLLTSLGAAALEAETGGSKAWLEVHVAPAVTSFASPAGAYDARTLAAISRHYTSHRTVNPGPNYMGTSVFELGVGRSFSDVPPAELCAQIAEAAQLRGWLIFVFHDFTAAPSTPYLLSYPIAGFEQALACARDTPGLDVVTVSEGAARLRCASP